MNARYSLQNIATLQGRKVFFDANVLIYIFWPSGSYGWESNYSSAFGSLLRQENELIVDFNVLSEVINRAIRIEHDKYLTANLIDRKKLSYKLFRDSAEGQGAMNDIYLIVKDDILPNFEIQGKAFTKADIESFLHVDNLDFMDKAFIPLCKENNFILLTNDKDFAGSDIEILSSNPSILNN